MIKEIMTYTFGSLKVLKDLFADPKIFKVLPGLQKVRFKKNKQPSDSL